MKIVVGTRGSKLALAQTNWVIDKLKEKYPNADIWRQLVGPVVGSHCGPDTMGVIFITK